jgi:2-oxoglutarate ferredoxin oxidoreductase subunit beta
MEIKDLSTKEENTWCPGCPNFGILESFKKAVAELADENKIKIKDTAIVTGIGCHAKIYDYLNLNGFYGIHGRVLPTALGIKVSNPGLSVVGFGGDGDTYAEGISHFIHACRYNADLTMIVHNNQVFSLTTGQATPTTEKGFVDGSTPLGVAEKPLNPITLALIAGASFVARGYALEAEHLKNIIKQAMEHKGFSFIDILQPCIIFHNVIPYFKKNIYKLEKSYDSSNLKEAKKRSEEWDYCFDPHTKRERGAEGAKINKVSPRYGVGVDNDKKVPIGVFYKIKKPAFEEQWPQQKTWHNLERKIDWKKIVKEFY